MEALSRPEQWRPVVGYEGLYEVSDQGRVRSLDLVEHLPANRRQKAFTRIKPGRMLRLTRDGKGYTNVSLSRNGKAQRVGVHRLVLLAFAGPPPADKPWALHGSAGQRDNSLRNLYWGDRQQNEADKLRDGTLLRGEQLPAAKLTPDQVRAIRADNRVHRVIAADYPVNRSVITAIKSRQAWAHLP